MNDTFIYENEEYKFLYFGNNIVNVVNLDDTLVNDDYVDTIEYQGVMVLEQLDDTIWIVPDVLFNKYFKSKAQEELIDRFPVSDK